MQAILLSREEVAQRAEQLYESRIRQEVEIEENVGKIVIIDIETGDYKVDKNSLRAADYLSEKHPNARLFGIKIGYNVGAAFGGGVMVPGPNFDPNAHYEVSFYRDPNYLSSQLVLTPGEYPDLNTGPINFGDAISSVKFNQGVPPAPPVTPIPVVAEFYDGNNYAGRKLIIFENVDDLNAYSALRQVSTRFYPPTVHLCRRCRREKSLELTMKNAF